MTDSLDAAILLLADLHLGTSYLDQSHRTPIDFPNALRLLKLGGRFQRFFRKQCKAHNQSILTALPGYLAAQLQAFRDREQYRQFEFDGYLLLGDLVTWPDPSAFSFLGDYLTQYELTVSVQSRNERRPGLHLPIAKLLAIPGNHDKLLRTDLSLFNNSVSKRLNIAPAVKNGVLLREWQVGPRRVLILTVEASAYAETQLTVGKRATSHLARGNISEPILEQARKIKDQLESERGKAWRILVIHYAIDFKRATDMSLRQALLNSLVPHECDGVERLFDSLGPEAIDCAIHGHLHIPRLYVFKGVPVVSVASASQLNAKPNGFHILKFMNNGNVIAEHHVWTPAGFDRDPDPSRSGSLV